MFLTRIARELDAPPFERESQHLTQRPRDIERRQVALAQARRIMDLLMIDDVRVVVDACSAQPCTLRIENCQGEHRRCATCIVKQVATRYALLAAGIEPPRNKISRKTPAKPTRIKKRRLYSRS